MTDRTLFDMIHLAAVRAARSGPLELVAMLAEAEDKARQPGADLPGIVEWIRRELVGGKKKTDKSLQKDVRIESVTE